MGDRGCQLFIDILEARAAEATIKAGQELARTDREMQYSIQAAQMEAKEAEFFNAVRKLITGLQQTTDTFDTSILTVTIDSTYA